VLIFSLFGAVYYASLILLPLPLLLVLEIRGQGGFNLPLLEGNRRPGSVAALPHPFVGKQRGFLGLLPPRWNADLRRLHTFHRSASTPFKRRLLVPRRYSGDYSNHPSPPNLFFIWN